MHHLRAPVILPLARNLLDYSLSLKRGEKILIEGETGCEELVRGLMGEAYVRGAQPFFELTDPTLRRAQLLGATGEQLDLEVSWRLARVKEMEPRAARGWILRPVRSPLTTSPPNA